MCITRAEEREGLLCQILSPCVFPSPPHTFRGRDQDTRRGIDWDCLNFNHLFIYYVIAGHTGFFKSMHMLMLIRWFKLNHVYILTHCLLYWFGRKRLYRESVFVYVCPSHAFFFFFFKFSLLRGGKKSLLTQQLDCGALPSMHHFRPVYIT